MEYICKFCGKQCKNSNSLRNHERLCKENPDRQPVTGGNHGHMPEHKKSYYTKNIKMNGVELDKTRFEIDEYSKEHTVCEICGRTIEECVKWNSKYPIKHFCIDHDHKTNKFRGLLCFRCNRQLGWYEKYKDEIENYLNK